MFHLDPRTCFYNSLHWWSINNQIQLVFLNFIFFTFLGSLAYQRFFWEEAVISLILFILIYIEYVSGLNDYILRKQGSKAYKNIIGPLPTL